MKHSPDPARLIAVYGALRSGTTLLRLILDAHPDICCPNERDFMLDFLRPGPTGLTLDTEALQADRIFRDSGLSQPKTTDGIAAFSEMTAEDAARGGKKLHALVLHRQLGQLLDLEPGIPIIHLIRDPRDVARSSIGMGWAGNTWHGVDHWIDTETGWKRQTHRMAADQVFELPYERLLENPEGTIRALCDFLHLDYTARMLDYSETSTYEPIDSSLAYQWKRKQHPRDVAELEYKLGDLLTASGYAPGPLPPRKPGRARRLALKLGNKRHIWKTMFRRFGYVDPIVLRVAQQLGLESVSRAAQYRMDEKKRTFLK